MIWHHQQDDTYIATQNGFILEISYDSEDFNVWDITDNRRSLIGSKYKLCAAKALGKQYVIEAMKQRRDDESGDLVLA